MSVITDLKEVIRIHETIIESKKIEQEYYEGILGALPGGYPPGKGFEVHENIRSGNNKTDIIRLITIIQKLEFEIERERKIIEGLEMQIEKLKKQVAALKGIEHKIKYMKLIEGKTLKEIAKELNYSYNYIVNMSSKIDKTKS